jgi:uncharacterized protein (TIGR00369 family)
MQAGQIMLEGGMIEMPPLEAVDPAKADSYPPNIRAILKRPSPASALLGLELVALNTDEGAVEIAFTASEQLCNKWGGLQGGMVAAMLDDALSIAAGLTLEWGQITPTLEMKTSFLEAAAPGRYRARARVIRRGKSVAFAEAALFNEAGALAATASATFSVVTLKKKQADERDPD